MGYCLGGIADISFNNEDDKVRFEQLLVDFDNSVDAAYQMLLREKNGESITKDTPLFPHGEQLLQEIINTPVIADKDLDRIKGVVTKQIATLNKRIKDLQSSRGRLKSSTDREARDKTIDELQDLLDELNTLETREQFIAIVEYAEQDLSRKLEWLKNGFNVDNVVHLDTFQEVVRQLDTYQGINTPKYAAKHSDLRNKIDSINDSYKEITELITDKRLEVLNGFRKYSTNPKYKDDKNWKNI